MPPQDGSNCRCMSCKHMGVRCDKKRTIIKWNYHDLTQALAGEDPPPQHQKYRDVTNRLKNVVSEENNRPVLDFLRGIAHNLQMLNVFIRLFSVFPLKKIIVLLWGEGNDMGENTRWFTWTHVVAAGFLSLSEWSDAI